MTNIVLLVKDRPRLTEQTLRTLYETTAKSEFNLTIVDDGSGAETRQIIYKFVSKGNMEHQSSFGNSAGCVGALKNFGARLSEDTFGRGSYLCFIDNDIAFMPGWLDRMVQASEEWAIHTILGGYRHPYHGSNGEMQDSHGEIIAITDAVAGYMHFMTWDTWDKFGPYDANATGVCQSEDHAICRRVVDAGGLVGYVEPAVIANCGVTNSEGKPAIGNEMFPRVKGLIYE